MRFDPERTNKQLLAEKVKHFLLRPRVGGKPVGALISG
jgi:hypothetical protein